MSSESTETESLPSKRVHFCFPLFIRFFALSRFRDSYFEGPEEISITKARNIENTKIREN